MPLQGKGVLAIWNGMAPGADGDFAAWHVREHMPERLAVPGFLRGRRYGAVDGHPAYFNFYETASPAVLTSPAYVARLNYPSPWTRRVVAQFRNTSRTACDVVASVGKGEGGVIETLRLRSTLDPAAFIAAMTAKVIQPALDAHGIVGVHLLQGRIDDSKGGTAEKALRDRPDELAEWVLLIEAIDPAAIQAARGGAASAVALAEAGTAAGPERGLYALQFGLSAEEDTAG